MASLVDLHPIDENQPTVTTPTSKNPPSFAHHLTPLSPQSSVTPNSGPPTARSTSNYIASVQQKAMENYEAELKRVNNEWSKKLDAQKKTFEEKLQNQEADFAWKYSTKEDEIEKLRVEKRKLEETVKNVEGIYQSEITRAQDNIDQLEGYIKQEMAKVKNLLLYAQADLRQVQGKLLQSDTKVKHLTEENQNLRFENENLLTNLFELEVATAKTVKTLDETRSKASSLELELGEKNKRVTILSDIIQGLQSKLKHETGRRERKLAMELKREMRRQVTNTEHSRGKENIRKRRAPTPTSCPLETCPKRMKHINEAKKQDKQFRRNELPLQGFNCVGYKTSTEDEDSVISGISGASGRRSRSPLTMKSRGRHNSDSSLN